MRAAAKRITLTYIKNSNFLVVSLSSVLAVLLRLEPLNDELFPYLFCDEEIWFLEAKRMLTEGTFVPKVFLSGSPVLLPVVGIARFLQSGLLSTKLTDFQLVVLARAVLIIPSIVGSIYILNKVLNLLKVSSRSRLVALIAFSCSPTSLAMSRYWYPDHFIVLPAAFALYMSIRIWMDETASFWRWSGLGGAIGVLASTKYSGFLMLAVVAPLVVVRYRTELRDSSGALLVFKLVLCTVGCVAGSFLILNFGALIHPSLFVQDFVRNNSIYEQFDGGAAALWTHLWYASILPFGLTATPILIGGVFTLARQRLSLFITLMIFPVILVVVLSNYGFGTSRNTAILLPFAVVVLGAGLDPSWTWLRGFVARPLIAMVCTLLLFTPMMLETVIGMVRDWRPDSRVLAQVWLKQNIPASTIVGVNEGCSGPTVPRLEGYATVNDPMMTERLEIYVLDSYWESYFSSAFKSEWWQRQYHFYRLGDDSIPPIPLLSSPRLIIPSDYQIRARFVGDGPEIIVIERRK